MTTRNTFGGSRSAAWLVAALLGTSGPAFASEALAKKYACLACHAVASKLVGPSYQEVAAKYAALSEAEIKLLVTEDKWLAALAAAAQAELDRVSQALTGRTRQLAERYAAPLPQLTAEVAALAARVDDHLRKMGATWL